MECPGSLFFVIARSPPQADDEAISEILTVGLLRSARNDRGHIDACERIQ